MSYLTDIMKTRHNIQFFSDKIPDKELIESILKKAHLLVPHKNNFWYYRVKVYGPEHKDEKRLIGMASVGGEGKDKFRSGNEEDIKRLGEIYDEWSSKENRKKGYRKVDGCNFNMQVTAPYLLVYTHQKNYMSKSQENSSYFKSGKQKEIFKLETNSVFLLSRFPVGSSANTISGSNEIALAIATLCCSPPDSSEGRLFLRFTKPKSSRSEIAFSFSLLILLICIGNITFSRAV